MNSESSRILTSRLKYDDRLREQNREGREPLVPPNGRNIFAPKGVGFRSQYALPFIDPS
jgi:hypothetical protein